MFETTPLSPNYREQRRWPRYKVEVPVQIILQRPAEPITHGLGTALNGGGLCISAPIDLQIGDQIGIEFSLPNCDELLRMRVRVRNRNGDHYGVEFRTETDDDHKCVGRIEFILKSWAIPAD
jgi:hypothetical protein